MEWQTIDSSPKDGTEILLYVPDLGGWSDNPAIVSARYEYGAWKDNAMVGCALGGNPTHWMHLPPHPKP